MWQWRWVGMHSGGLLQPCISRLRSEPQESFFITASAKPGLVRPRHPNRPAHPRHARDWAPLLLPRLGLRACVARVRDMEKLLQGVRAIPIRRGTNPLCRVFRSSIVGTSFHRLASSHVREAVTPGDGEPRGQQLVGAEVQTRQRQHGNHSVKGQQEEQSD